ncbi:maleylacetate reductase [Frondihabitans sp. PAMC 28766]|uniref:maleylacetate reductase n=1 Tax=Frondihabitans sp. PAMC 28766 TaxID=1795630 RepID=UPI00078BB708|nr:maleylacetate reductase [Frondihabitans sp. PAMC 28766]AMM18928.1 maleylacetate reductase [Frondihabitans sp. PAMC 28766]
MTDSLVFTHTTLAARVHFGSGLAARHVAAEVEGLGARRVMLITTKSRAAPAGIARDLPVALSWTDVVQHVPVAKAEEARRAAAEADIDLIVAVGGGSTTGLAKAVALTSGIPIVAVPTTYAGSEATDVWGLTDEAGKTTGSDPRVLPVAIVYDAALTVSLPVPLSVASGLNAIAHCVDSLWAPRADPINAGLATEGIRALASGLRSIHADPLSTEGRQNALLGTYLAAVAFASAGSGLHHKVCHVLGGAFGLPHAETHATVLPYVTAFNTPSAPDAERRLADAFGADTGLDGLGALRLDIDAPVALRDYGLAEADVPRAAELILPAVPPSNPRPVTRGDLERLLEAAWAGTPPETL